jgi:hypothetical protein
MVAPYHGTGYQVVSVLINPEMASLTFELPQLRNVFSAQVVAGAGGGVPPQLDHVVG